jgi:CDP-diacylglycerol--glycerol-3-phosphate 3-phosphatidyltransferase
MDFNIPNLLTLFRIVLIPVFVAVYLLPFPWVNVAATLVFALAALTDWLDGYFARRLNQTSAFGAFLDPVADKLMVAVALILIVDQNPTPWPGVWLAAPAAVIVGREIAVSALREWMAELGARAHVAVSVIGKIKTGTQMVSILFLLYAEPLFGVPVVHAGFALLYISALLTLWSMFIYLRAAWPILNGNQDSRSANGDIRAPGVISAVDSKPNAIKMVDSLAKRE